LHWFERGYAEHDEYLALLRVDPRLDTLRADPRFISLLHRIGLANPTNRQTLGVASGGRPGLPSYQTVLMLSEIVLSTDGALSYTRGAITSSISISSKITPISVLVLFSIVASLRWDVESCQAFLICGVGYLKAPSDADEQTSARVAGWLLVRAVYPRSAERECLSS
jgi:hypothetical protein